MTIARLFGKSPFSLLQGHLKKVASCMEQVSVLFQAFWKEDRGEVVRIGEVIGKLEHEADLVKSEIRNQLPRGLFLPVDRGHLYEILSMQDDLADKAEDIAVLCGLRPIPLIRELQAPMEQFWLKNQECFIAAKRAVNELGEVLESGFGGPETIRLREMARHCAYLEHEADLLQRQLLRDLYAQEAQLTFITFDFWSRLISEMGSVADLSENLADRVRMLTEGT
ncbi:MAG: TIGR00153 family protein [Chlamydiia bacterium]